MWPSQHSSLSLVRPTCLLKTREKTDTDELINVYRRTNYGVLEETQHTKFKALQKAIGAEQPPFSDLLNYVLRDTPQKANCEQWEDSISNSLI